MEDFTGCLSSSPVASVQVFAALTLLLNLYLLGVAVEGAVTYLSPESHLFKNP